MPDLFEKAQFSEKTQSARGMQSMPLQGTEGEPKDSKLSSLWLAGMGGAMAAGGVWRGGIAGWLVAGAGSALLYRTLTGHFLISQGSAASTSLRHQAAPVPLPEGVESESFLEIQASTAKLYDFCRHPENLPRFLEDFVSVESLDERHSDWVARGILGATVNWHAEIVEDRPNERIAWRSMPGSDVDATVTVSLEPVAEGRKTRVYLATSYRSPADKAGEGITRMLGENLENKLIEALRRLKQVIEQGDQGLPAGGKVETEQTQGSGFGLLTSAPSQP